MKKKQYETMQAQCMQELEIQKKRYNRCSLLRVAAALVALVSFVSAIQFSIYAGYVLGALGILVFLFLIAWHNQIEARQKYELARKEVLEEYIGRFGEDWKQLEEDGREYLTNDFPQARDLDLFGKASLYQYLCAANTIYGENCLAQWLKNGNASIPELQARQKAVRELADKKEFPLRLQSLGRMMKHNKAVKDQQVTAEFMETICQNDSRPTALSILMWGFPFVTLFFLLSALFGVQTRLNLSIFFLCFLLQVFFVLLSAKRNSRILKPIYRFYRSIAPYQSMFARIEQEAFKSEKLCEIQKILRKNGGASNALKQLGRIGEAVNARHNGLAFLLYNGLWLWDFHCADQIIRWKDRYRDQMEPWLQLVGEVEALISLCVLCAVKKDYTFPRLQSGTSPSLSFENLKHPLIREDKAEGNDLCAGRCTCIITGSNMSGKTTFLRTVGVNLALAYAGGPVHAGAFSAARMTVLTSMRVEDSVSEGISTFYAELLRIKGMIDYRKKGLPMLALIDEIYKGTNSRDRIIGATETIRRLSGPQVLLMVTTHDFELCELEKDPAAHAVNYHFAERYSGDEILFDYKMKPGRCRTTNAQHLLRLAGIL